MVGATTAADAIALGSTQNGKLSAPPGPGRKGKPVRAKGRSSPQRRKQKKAPKVIQPGKTKVRKRQPRRKS
jgi:hypothetical protein